MSEKKDIYWRAYLIYFAFVVLMLVVLIRVIAIQFEGGKPVYMSSVEGNEKMPTRTVSRKPRRGQILDANYTPLVTSVSFYNIHMDPTVVDQELFDSELSDLCIALNDLYPEKTARDYELLIRKGRAETNRFILIHALATNDERRLLWEMPIFEKGRFKGGLLDDDEIITRKRPHGELMKRTLGYVRVQADGTIKKVGIEQAYDDYLTGEPGKEVEQKISNSWKKTGPIIKDAVEGASIVTTIDKEIQEVAHTELLKQLERQVAKSGSVIVMDVKTGYVKAIVNLVRNKNGLYDEGYNHAIGTKEVPGSTFKLASLMALLEDGKVALTDVVDAKGKYTYYKSTLTDSRAWGYGEITIQQAFEKSSNVISQVVNDAYRHEPQAFVDRLKGFGLGDKLGIELMGEPKPTLYEPGTSNWSGISLPWMSVGYEVQQTPLQTLAFYNAVANNGTFMRPQFVKEIRRGNEVVKTFAPVILKNKICSDKTLKDLHKCLKGVVQRGTGKALKSAYFDISGKTGTARILNDDLRYGAHGETRHQASFAGFFPSDNPVYSCIVVISAPSKDIYGAVVSGTVFTAIANKVYASSLQYHTPINEGSARIKGLPRTKVGSRMDITKLYKRFGIPFNTTTDQEYVIVTSEQNKAILERRFTGKTTVPNVSGMTAKDAVYLLESAGMTVKIKGYGKVVKQSIRAGSDAIKGVLIEIELK
ncbi:MAG: cell division protein FtsI (penicillin-binding protein 3) [Flavobacteriaceae bacterium]